MPVFVSNPRKNQLYLTKFGEVRRRQSFFEESASRLEFQPFPHVSAHRHPNGIRSLCVQFGIAFGWLSWKQRHSWPNQHRQTNSKYPEQLVFYLNTRILRSVHECTLPFLFLRLLTDSGQPVRIWHVSARSRTSISRNLCRWHLQSHSATPERQNPAAHRALCYQSETAPFFATPSGSEVADHPTDSIQMTP